MKHALPTLALALASCSPPAAQSPVTAPRATIDEAAWLAGRWVGEGLGGSVEESWSPPRGGQMAGHFRLVRDGKPAFYEFMLLDEHRGGLRLRVKHFNPDFVGWEEKDGWHSFEPLSVKPGELRFEGLSLRLEADELVSIVQIRDRKNDWVRAQMLRHRRQPL